MIESGYPAAPAVEISGTGMRNIALRRNTIKTAGGGGINQLWGHNLSAVLNHVQGTGKLIIDNQGIGGGQPSRYCTMSYNWVHDSTGLGFRW